MDPRIADIGRRLELAQAAGLQWFIMTGIAACLGLVCSLLLVQ